MLAEVEGDGPFPGQLQPLASPYATVPFADLLVLLLPTLKNLSLFSGCIEPLPIPDELAEHELHLGSFDHALSHAGPTLEALLLPWALTGPNFLQSLGGAKNLSYLSMHDDPVTGTSAQRLSTWSCFYRRMKTALMHSIRLLRC